MPIPPSVLMNMDMDSFMNDIARVADINYEPTDSMSSSAYDMSNELISSMQMT